MAAVLSAYLIANGAADRRLPPPDGQPKPGTDAKPDAEPRQATRPDTDGSSPQVDRRGRRRLVRPGEAPDAAKPGDDVPAQSASERGPDGRRLRRGRPGSEELPKTDAKPNREADTSKTDTSKTDAAKTDAAKTDTSKTDAAKTDAARDEPSKGEPAKDVKPSSETAKGEDGKPEGSKPSGDGRSEAAKEAVKDRCTKGGGRSLRYCGPIRFLRLRRRRPSLRGPARGGCQIRFPNGPRSRRRHPLRRPEPPSVTASAPPPAPAGPPAPPISQ